MQGESSTISNTEKPGKTGKASPVSLVACGSLGLLYSMVTLTLKLFR